MKNRAIELHDSQVLSIFKTGQDVVVDLSAYVHETDGRPGIDAGTGWSQSFRITVVGGRVCRQHTGRALRITDGTVTVGGKTFDNMVPATMLAEAPVELVFSGQEGVLVVAGTGIRLEATGDAKFVEDVPEGENGGT